MTCETSSAPEAIRPPLRTVIVVDETLAGGQAANAAAVLAITLGARVPGLAGADLVDADGRVHPGLIRTGLPVLAAASTALRAARDRAAALADVVLVDFLSQGHDTNDYEQYRQLVAGTPTAALRYLGIALCGPRPAINKLVGGFRLLR